MTVGPEHGELKLLGGALLIVYYLLNTRYLTVCCWWTQKASTHWIQTIEETLRHHEHNATGNHTEFLRHRYRQLVCSAINHCWFGARLHLSMLPDFLWWWVNKNLVVIGGTAQPWFLSWTRPRQVQNSVDNSHIPISMIDYTHRDRLSLLHRVTRA